MSKHQEQPLLLVHRQTNQDHQPQLMSHQFPRTQNSVLTYFPKSSTRYFPIGGWAPPKTGRNFHFTLCYPLLVQEDDMSFGYRNSPNPHCTHLLLVISHKYALEDFGLNFGRRITLHVSSTTRDLQVKTTLEPSNSKTLRCLIHLLDRNHTKYERDKLQSETHHGGRVIRLIINQTISSRVWFVSFEISLCYGGVNCEKYSID